MRSKLAIIIFGGLGLISLLSLLLPQLALAEPKPPQILEGEVRVGSNLAGAGRVILVKGEDGRTLSPSPGSVDTTFSDGTFRFGLKADDPDTTEIEGGKNGEALFFFVSGVAATTSPETVTFQNGVRTSVNLSIPAPPAPPVGGGGPPPNQPPNSVAGPDQTVDEGAIVFFGGTASTDSDGTIVSSDWDFGDGATGDGVTVNHVYVDNGFFTVTLTVTDDDGDTGTDTLTVTVNNVAPTVVAGLDQRVEPGDLLTINPTFTDPGSSDTHTATIDWDDGTPVTIIEPAVSPLSTDHIFILTGDFTVTVTVTDDDGDAGSDGLMVVVTVVPNEPPIANAGPDQTVSEGDTVFLAGTDSEDPDGDIIQFDWDFGDGGVGQGATVSHVYPENGAFTVTLTVTDNEGATGNDTALVTVVNVAPIVKGGADQDADEGDTVGISATFTDPSAADTHIATIDWDDGSLDTVIDPAFSPLSASHVYTDDGTFFVTVTITDNDGGFGSDTLEVDVDNVAPDVEAGDGQAAFVGDLVSFAGSFSDPGADDTHTFEWDFDDGAGVTGTLTPTHTYTTDDKFTVTLTVTDDDGEEGEDTVEIFVLPLAEEIPGIEVSDLVLTSSTSAGDTVGASFIATNNSDPLREVSATINLNLNAELHQAFDITLGPGESRLLDLLDPEVNNPVIPIEPGLYVVSVLNLVQTFSLTPALFVIEQDDLEVSPRSAAEDDTVTITAVGTNVGDVPATFTVLVKIDGSTFEVHEVFAAPGESARITSILTIQAPFTGPSAFRRHTVVLGGENVQGKRDGYTVRKPVSIPVSNRLKINPATTKTFDENNNPLDVGTGDVEFGTGSISLKIPVRAQKGVKIASFVDTTSGISILGRNVEVPVKDPDTGRVLLRMVGTLVSLLEGTMEGDAAQGVFESLRWQIQEESVDLSADDPKVGRLGVSFDALLNGFPQGVSLEINVKKELRDKERTDVELKVREETDNRENVVEEAGVITVRTENLEKADVGPVTITTKVSLAWIQEFGIRNVRIAHIDVEGNVEILIPECVPSAEGPPEFICIATTTQGFSQFSLLAPWRPGRRSSWHRTWWYRPRRWSLGPRSPSALTS